MHYFDHLNENANWQHILIWSMNVRHSSCRWIGNRSLLDLALRTAGRVSWVFSFHRFLDYGCIQVHGRSSEFRVFSRVWWCSSAEKVTQGRIPCCVKIRRNALNLGDGWRFYASWNSVSLKHIGHIIAPIESSFTGLVLNRTMNSLVKLLGQLLVGEHFPLFIRKSPLSTLDTSFI